MSLNGGVVLYGGILLAASCYSKLRSTYGPRIAPSEWVWSFAWLVIPSIGFLVWRTYYRPEFYSVGEFQGVGWDPGKMLVLFSPSLAVGIGKILLSLLFPLSVFCTAPSRCLRDRRLCLGWCVFLAGLALTVCFVEKGERLEHGNFAWCAVCGLFILCVESFRHWFTESRQPSPLPPRLAVTLSLVLQGGAGLAYWAHVVRTGLVE
jgi:hypothetical protein